MARLRVVVVGAGVVAQFWAQPLRRRAEVVGLVGRSEGRAREAVARLGLDCPAFASLEDALATASPDVVVNLTPAAAHREVVESALDAGCHVVTEKPMAPSFEDARALVRAAERTGRTLAVMQNRRYQPAIRRLRQGLDSGAIGVPVQLCADLFMAPRHGNPELERQAHPLLLDMAVHTFDQARFLAGAEPLSVVCHEFNPPQSWYAGAAAAVATFEFERGIVFSFRANWVAEGFPTSYDAAWRIVGTDGSARWDSFGAPECEVRVGPPPRRGVADLHRSTWEPGPTRDETGHAGTIDALLDALEAGRPPETSGSDNLRTLAMVFGAIRSAEERRAVALGELLGRE
jgi:predicted dehydrogenase